jgi:hypothetical protein
MNCCFWTRLFTGKGAEPERQNPAPASPGRSWLAALRAEAFSPKDLVQRAVFIAVLYLAAHLAGLREFATFLSGTAPVTTLSWQWVAFLGAAYLIVYFAFILLAPMLLIAAALLAAWGALCRRR